MLSEENSKYTLFDQLINNNIRFAVYKLPFSDNIELILQISEPKMQYNDILSLYAKHGFVIAPFSISKQYPIVIIDPEIKIGGEDKILDYIDQLKLPQGKEPSGTRMLTAGLDSFEKYRSVFDLFHNNIVEGKLQKLVLSRTLDIDKRNDWSAGITFNKACKKYIQNFVYLCHTPETGSWIGCSPEVILEGNSKQWKTDALAGTKKILSDDKEVLWDLKNSKEQAIVSDYIQNQLHNIDIDVIKEEPQTIRSGDLIHLRSEFRFSMENKEKLGSILNALHPTPAVSGYPKEDASRFIQNNEGYERAYYAGFVGPLDIDDRTDLYVNLRCMQITTDTLRLYAGGGIMPESEAQSEWLETEYKLQTILSIL